MTYKPAIQEPAIQVPLTAFGDNRVAELSPIFHGSFEYSVTNTLLFEITSTNGGAVTQGLGMAVINTSTTTNSTAELKSVQHLKYHPGLGGLARFTALFTSPVANTEQYIGLAGENGVSEPFDNGYMVGYDGTTFGFHRFSNDVKTSVPQASWDDPMDGTGLSGMTLDQTKINIFYIQFQYLGAGAIKLFVESDSTGDLVLVHTIDYANANVEPSVHNPNFHFIMWTNNKATTSNLTIKSSSYGAFIEGKVTHIERHIPLNSSGAREKTTVTTEVAIFTIRSKALFASKTNLIDILFLGIQASIEAGSANNLGQIRIIKNATLGGAPSYTDINTTDSIIEIDTAGTTVSGGTEIAFLPLAGKNDRVITDVSSWNITLNPGDTLTIAGLSANSATIRAAVVWHELF